VTAGVDFALTLIAELAGQEVAKAIELNLEYAPAPPFGTGRPETAPAAAAQDGPQAHRADRKGASQARRGGGEEARPRQSRGRGPAIKVRVNFRAGDRNGR
jgi:cyclohexyl-isocyanide hydratase